MRKVNRLVKVEVERLSTPFLSFLSTLALNCTKLKVRNSVLSCASANQCSHC